MNCQYVDTPARNSTLGSVPSTRAPATLAATLARPPLSSAPPRATEAIELSVNGSPMRGSPDVACIVRNSPPIEANSPHSTNATTLVRATSMPLS